MYKGKMKEEGGGRKRGERGRWERGEGEGGRRR